MQKGPDTVQDISNEVVTEQHTPFCGLYFNYCLFLKCLVLNFKIMIIIFLLTVVTVFY